MYITEMPNITDTIVQSAIDPAGIDPAACFIILFLFGGISAIISKTLSAPIDRIKLIQQTLFRPSYVELEQMDSRMEFDEVFQSDEESCMEKPLQMTPLKFGIISCAHTSSNVTLVLSDIDGTLQPVLGVFEEEPSEQSDLKKPTPVLKSGIISCVKYIYQTEGFFGLWRGNFVNCLRVVPKTAFDMAFKDRFNEIAVEVINPGKDLGLKILSTFLSGTAAAMLSTIITYPLDYIRTRLAVDIGTDKSEKQFNGIMDVIKKTMSECGVFGLYSGIGICLLGEIVYRGPRYGLYDGLKGPLGEVMGIESENKIATFFFNWMFGWFIGCVAGTISYPIDTIRRVQMKNQTGIVKSTRELYRDHGIVRFFRGNISACISRWSGGLILALFDLLEGTIEC